MYQAPELTRDSAPIRLRALFAGNAFEKVVRARYPAVDEALRWLGRHAEPRLTGSGACVFAVFGSRADAERILARRPSGFEGFVAKGLKKEKKLTISKICLKRFQIRTNSSTERKRTTLRWYSPGGSYSVSSPTG